MLSSPQDVLCPSVALSVIQPIFFLGRLCRAHRDHSENIPLRCGQAIFSLSFSGCSVSPGAWTLRQPVRSDIGCCLSPVFLQRLRYPSGRHSVLRIRISQPICAKQSGSRSHAAKRECAVPGCAAHRSLLPANQSAWVSWVSIWNTKRSCWTENSACISTATIPPPLRHVHMTSMKAFAAHR